MRNDFKHSGVESASSVGKRHHTSVGFSASNTTIVLKQEERVEETAASAARKQSKNHRRTRLNESSVAAPQGGAKTITRSAHEAKRYGRLA